MFASTSVRFKSNVVENRRVVGVDRFHVGMKRLGRFAPFADGDSAADARAKLVVDDQFFARLVLVAAQIRPATAAPPVDSDAPSKLGCERLSVTVPMTFADSQ